MRGRVSYHDSLARKPQPEGRDAPLSIDDMLVEVNDFLASGRGRGYDVFAESGDMLFGGLEVRLRKGGLYFAQGYYASMGFAVPAATGPEIAFAPSRGLAPIVVLVNNSGWGIFRAVTPRRQLLEIPAWPYAEMARGWGGVGMRVETRAALHDALRAADEARSFAIVECVVPPDDSSPVSRRYIRTSAKKARAGQR